MAPWVWTQLILLLTCSVLWVPTCWSLCITSKSSLQFLRGHLRTGAEHWTVRVTWWAHSQVRSDEVMLCLPTSANKRTVCHLAWGLTPQTGIACLDYSMNLFSHLCLFAGEFVFKVIPNAVSRCCLLFLTTRREAMMCLPEKMCVLNFIQKWLCNAAGYEFNTDKLTICIE